MKSIPKQQQSVVILRDNGAGSGGIASLAAQTAVSIESGHGTGLLSSVLLKRVHATVTIRGAVADEIVVIGMARGDATVTQIKAALEDIQLERDRKGQAAKRDVLFETVDTIQCVAIAAGPSQSKMEISLGGGKGIPFEKGDGFQWFAYNPESGAHSAGSQTVLVDATYYGIWLE